MPFISSANSSAALLILQQNKITSTPINETSSAATDLVATANGQSKQTEQTEVKPASDYWDVMRVDITQLKIKLIERLGEEFGFKPDDYETQSALGGAIRSKVTSMRQQDPIAAAKMISEIEKNLGLGELGISLDTLIDAVMEPGGSADDKLDAALMKQAEEDGLDETQLDLTSGSIVFDSNGLYSLFG
ncbi:MAG: hypothetical protein JKX93_15540 [Rhizobiaceae bacterium]|nr:hypothetical protein [Rhizobiaceae bacterium]